MRYRYLALILGICLVISFVLNSAIATLLDDCRGNQKLLIKHVMLADSVVISQNDTIKYLKFKLTTLKSIRHE